MVTANQLQILQSPITGLISSVSMSVTMKLDETNYLQWHFQMQLMLEVHGIIGFVDGSNLCPAQFSSSSSRDSEVTSGTSSSRTETDEYKVWKMHDHSLMLLLTATLSSSAISCVIGSKSFQEMWVHIQNQFFLPSTKTSIIKLQTDLYTIKKGSNSISQYLQRIKEARDGLSILGVIFADEDFVIIALNGLPPNYNTFKCVLRGRESIISLTDFRAQLLAEEAIVDCALVEYETKGSFFPLFSSQFHVGFNGGYYAQSNFSSCQSSYGNNVDSYNGILGSPPSLYPSSLPLNSTTEASISAPKQNNCDKPIIMKPEEQPARSVGAESSQTSGSAKLPTSCESTQLLEVQGLSILHFSTRIHLLHQFAQVLADLSQGKYNAKLFLDSFLVQLVVLAIWEKSIQIAAHAFRGSYVFRLCNVGDIFDIQVGYHMGICDKGGGTRSMLIWLLWYT